MVCRRTSLLLFLAYCLTIALPTAAHAQSASEEALRRKFLKARQQMRTVPRTSDPAPVATQATPEPKPEEVATAKAEPNIRSAEPQIRPAEVDVRPAERPTPPPQVQEEPAKPTPTSPPQATPSPTPEEKRNPPPADVQKMSADLTIQKSGLQEEEGEVAPPEPEKKKWSLFGGGRDSKKYKYLSKSVRAAIDNARVKKNRWKYIVVHNSGTRQGSAKAYENYHRRVRKMQNGLAYHFVIGNGKGAGAGEVEIGGRWTKQINGGHVASDYLNNIAIGICLTGDYNRDRVPQQQLEALEELLNYLRKRVGKVDGKLSIVRAHRQINPKPTDCPGDRFPYDWLAKKFRS